MESGRVGIIGILPRELPHGIGMSRVEWGTLCLRIMAVASGQRLDEALL
jgi:hypothetical protein